MTGVIEFLPLIAGVLGIATAYLCYSIEPDLPARLAMQYRCALPVPAQQMVLRRAV